jgi:hypothetical protein
MGCPERDSESESRGYLWGGSGRNLPADSQDNP